MSRRGVTKLPCGCEHNDTEWLVMCVACRADYDDRHKRWAAEYRESTERLPASRKARELL